MAEMLLFSMTGTSGAFTNRAMTDSTYKKWTKTLSDIAAEVPQSKWISLTATLTVDSYVAGTGMSMTACRKGTASGYANEGSSLGQTISKVGSVSTTYTAETTTTMVQFINRVANQYVFLRYTNGNSRVDKWSYKAVLSYGDDEPSKIYTDKDQYDTTETATIRAEFGDGVDHHKVSFAFNGQEAFLSESFHGETSVAISKFRDEFPRDGRTTTATVTLISYNIGGKELGRDSKEILLQVGGNMAPILTVDDENVSTVRGYALQGKSVLTFTPAAAGRYGAEIVGVQAFVQEGSQRTQIVSGGTINGSGELHIVYNATDSRGMQIEVSHPLYVYAYNLPKIITTETKRCNAQGDEDIDGTHALCYAEGQWTALPGDENALLARVHVQLIQDGTGATVDGGSVFMPAEQVIRGGGLLDVDSRWIVRYILEDGLGGTAELEDSIGSGQVFMAWEPSKNAFGFGQRPAGTNQVYINDSWEIIYKGMPLDQYIRSIINS